MIRFLFLASLVLSVQGAAAASQFVILVSASSQFAALDPESQMARLREEECEEEPKRNVPGIIVLDYNLMEPSLREAIANGTARDWEVNGERFVPMSDPNQDKQKARINLFEGDGDSVSLSGRGLEYRSQGFRGSFNGERVRIRLDF